MKSFFFAAYAGFAVICAYAQTPVNQAPRFDWGRLI
jgi:hypothetical protein